MQVATTCTRANVEFLKKTADHEIHWVITNNTVNAIPTSTILQIKVASTLSHLFKKLDLVGITPSAHVRIPFLVCIDVVKHQTQEYGSK